MSNAAATEPQQSESTPVSASASTTTITSASISTSTAKPNMSDSSLVAPATSAEMEHSSSTDSNVSSSGSSVVDGEQRKTRLDRPRMGNRKSSGTIIVPRDSAEVELKDEVFDEDDARAMSPRRNSEDVEKMGQEARQALEKQARALQASLSALVDRVEIVKTEHDKLEGENKFLQSYIGELMSTSKITSTGAGRNKGTRAK
ncbi:MAG: hypothetical protein M4579_002301 [Chaenotheca gracillima]|nr:MAG: hypothetical protein M4579_002301 [Chaenotheca gracillima]